MASAVFMDSSIIETSMEPEVGISPYTEALEVGVISAAGPPRWLSVREEDTEAMLMVGEEER